MIELTVKTLDSRNHAFSVEDDITVAQFKEKIAEAINIPVETQRLIYCGRVLQDQKKLNEYDVNGKVVHLVQRAPPPGGRRREDDTPPVNSGSQRREGFRGLPRNMMYLGSVSFPSGVGEPSPVTGAPPTQSLSASRLNVARRMLRRAESVLNHLENPSRNRTPDVSPPEETQEEATPVFEAQVVVPATVESLPHVLMSSFGENGAAANMPEDAAMMNGEGSASEAREEASASSDNTSSDTGSFQTPQQSQPSTSQSAGLPESASRTQEMVRLLDQLQTIQTRFNPFLERYYNFMRDDPSFPPEPVEDMRAFQTLINRVSEIMHLLGHAYHSLSDIMVRVRSPPPRPLLCRPILIQHSAIVQAGIPIQVEAQINFSADSLNQNNNTNASSTATTANAATATPSSTANTTASTNTAGAPPPGVSIGGINPANLPWLQGIRMESFPIEIRNLAQHPNINVTVQRPATAAPAPSTTAAAAETGAAAAAATAPAQPPSNASATPSSTLPSAPPLLIPITTASGNQPNNVEFFMEVTPESITIDSLETRVLNSAQQTDNVLRQQFGGPPPDFIQSIIQAVAGQIMNRSGSDSPNAPNQQQQQPQQQQQQQQQSNQEAAGNSSGAFSSLSSSPPNQQPSGQNSQARGNTQTHPTTSTQTRSTSRPQVHLSQHSLQSFDPFLPCNSHHIAARRRILTQHQQQQHSPPTGMTASAPPSAPSGASGSGDQQQNNNQMPNPIYNIMQNILGSLRNVYNVDIQQGQRPGGAAGGVPATGSAASGAQSNGQNVETPQQRSQTAGLGNARPPPQAMTPLQIFNYLFSSMPNVLNPQQNTNEMGGMTIATMLQHFPNDSYTEGESIFMDLIMLLARSFTFGDVIQLTGGSLEPLFRVQNQLSAFVSTRVMNDESCCLSNINRGVDRLIEDMQPLLDMLVLLPCREGTNFQQAATRMFRLRLPYMLYLARSNHQVELRTLVEQCKLILRQFFALALHCSARGQEGVETFFQEVVTRYMTGIPQEIQQWTLLTSRHQLRRFMSTLSVPESTLRPYLEDEHPVEPMDLDESTGWLRLSPLTEEDANGLMDAAPVAEPVVPRMAAASVAAVPIPAVIVPEPIPESAQEQLPMEEAPVPVVLGSEPWHGQVPADWVPIITRDGQRQRRQNSQPAYSDAYLSGMPSKRRKIVNGSKPQGSLPQVISESVRRAVTSTGLSGAAPLDVVCQAASNDINIQTAYRELLRTTVQNGLRDNQDLTPERFPNASAYFNPSSPPPPTPPSQ